MRPSIRRLKFSVSDKPFGNNLEKIKRLTGELKEITKKAGTENKKFKAASSDISTTVRLNRYVDTAIVSKVHVRALAIALPDHGKLIKIRDKLFEKIYQLTPKPGSLLIGAMYQHFLNQFDEIEGKDDLIYWLIWARGLRNESEKHDRDLISINGPRWLASSAVESQIDFDQQLEELKLHHYSSGRFMTLSKRIYYVEQLFSIPVNKDHVLLNELQKPVVFRSRYDDEDMLGHRILKILIDRAPHEKICDSWRDTIVAIAGDPRVPNSSRNYIKWWNHIGLQRIAKVRGWMSRLDLRLFLEALKNYSKTSGNAELMRMYPSRKNFLEGLLDDGHITHTRLYLSSDAEYYLKANFKAEHLPKYSNVDGAKSIIHVQLGDRHIIEGSHTCYLRVYESLDESATVFDYNKRSETYVALTSQMEDLMLYKGCRLVDRIQHNPANFFWQRKAVKALNSIGVGIEMKKVLTDSEYSSYIRHFGVDTWD